MKHICDCGATYGDLAGLEACQISNHGMKAGSSKAGPDGAASASSGQVDGPKPAPASLEFSVDVAALALGERHEFKIAATEFSSFIAAHLGVDCERVSGAPRIRIDDAGNVTFVFDMLPPGEAAAAVKPLPGPNPNATKTVALAAGGKY